MGLFKSRNSRTLRNNKETEEKVASKRNEEEVVGELASKRSMEEDDGASGDSGEGGALGLKGNSLRSLTDEIHSLYERMKRMVDSAVGEKEPMSESRQARYNLMNERMTKLVRLRDQKYRMMDAASVARDTRANSIARIVERRGMSPRKAVAFANTVDSPEYRSAFQRYLVSGSDRELRAMTEGVNTDGGFLPSTDFYNQLIEKRFQANAMRQVATVMPLGTFKTEVTIESTFGSANYIAEAGEVTEVSPTFANITLKPYTLRYFTKVSNELIADAPSRGGAFSIETILANQIGRVIGLREETAFTVGTGSAQPKGIFTYTSGSGTTISSVTAASASTITAANLMAVVYALPRQYRANAKWVMSDATFALIRNLLQTQSIGSSPAALSYAPFGWSMGDGRLQDGEPDRLLGYPVVCVADAPTIAANAIAAVFGDFSYYRIGEREGVSIQTAREAFLGTNQTGYYAFARHDAQATLLDAFRYLKMAAS